MKVNNKQRLFLSFAAILLIYWLILLLTNQTSSKLNYLDGFLYSIVTDAAGIIALLKASYWEKERLIRKGVAWGGLGLFFWGTGGVIWAYYNFFLNNAIPYPSVADIFYLPGMLFCSVGVFYFARASGPDLRFRSLKKKIFFAGITIGVAVISYFLLVAVARKGEFLSPANSAVDNFLDIAYPYVDFVGLTIAALILGTSFKYVILKYRIALLSLIAGLVFMFISDTYFSYIVIHGSFLSDNLSDLFFTLATSMLVFGVLGFCNEETDPAPRKIHLFEFMKYY